MAAPSHLSGTKWGRHLICRYKMAAPSHLSGTKLQLRLTCRVQNGGTVSPVGYKMASRSRLSKWRYIMAARSHLSGTKMAAPVADEVDSNEAPSSRGETLPPSSSEDSSCSVVCRTQSQSSHSPVTAQSQTRHRQAGQPPRSGCPNLNVAACKIIRSARIRLSVKLLDAFGNR